MAVTERVLNVALHEKQKEFLDSRCFSRAFVAGRGAGKTFILMYDLLQRAQKGCWYLVGSHTYERLEDTVIRTFKDLGGRECLNLIKSFRMAPHPQATLYNGAVVIFRSTEVPDKFRGPNLSGVVFDEAGLAHEDAYKNAMLCLREGGLGWLSLGFTPKGRRHWTYKRFGKNTPTNYLVHCTTYDNPFLSEDFVHEAEKMAGSGDFARQELEGIFLDDIGGLEVIPASWVEAAQERWQPDSYLTPLSCIGVDIARGGSCRTVLARRHGMQIHLDIYPGFQTPDGDSVAQLVDSILSRYPLGASRVLVNVDLIGIGSSPYDACKKLGRANTVGINFACRCQATDKHRVLRFMNIRAFAYWSLRELLDPSANTGFALPRTRVGQNGVDELVEELSAARWEMTATGIKIQPKEEIEEEIGRSPDMADAIAYSILLPGVMSGVNNTGDNERGDT